MEEPVWKRGFVTILREVGLIGPTRTSGFPAAGEAGAASDISARDAGRIPEDGGEFAPHELDEMKQVFDEACAQRDALSEEHRTAIASVIFSAYRAGERDRARLLDVAVAAAL